MRIGPLFVLVAVLAAPSFAARRACAEDLKLLAGTPSFEQLAERVLGPKAMARVGANAGTPTRLSLTVEDLDDLFSGVDDPWMHRMKRYLHAGVAQGDIQIHFEGDPKETERAAGTCWSGGCGVHDIRILLDANFLAGNPQRDGIRASVRATLIHEATHARIRDHLYKWLDREALDLSLARSMSTATEEYLARLSDQRAVGFTGTQAKVRAWISTWVDGGEVANPFSDLESAWTKVLKARGIRLEDRPARLEAREAEKVRKAEALVRQRASTLRDFQGNEAIAELRVLLVDSGKITAQKWTELETVVVEDLHRQWGRYMSSGLARAVETHARQTLGIEVVGDYGTNIIYEFRIADPK